MTVRWPEKKKCTCHQLIYGCVCLAKDFNEAIDLCKKANAESLPSVERIKEVVRDVILDWQINDVEISLKYKKPKSVLIPLADKISKAIHELLGGKEKQ